MVKSSTMEKYNRYFRQGDLIAKSLKGELNAEERAELDAWLAESEHNQALFTKLTEEGRLDTDLERFADSNKEDAWKRIVAETGFAQTGQATYNRNRVIQYLAAAVVLLVSGLLVYRFYDKSQPVRPVAVRSADILPGGNKAILTLADASKIVLDEAKTGKIATQANVSIMKTADGQLVYNTLKSTLPVPAAKGYNTITTPRGGKFRVVLPDGSKVWLNAASALTYPTQSWETDREVRLDGEAYFEIAHAKKNRQEALPFRVRSREQVVEVLGTHFNINSYSDETSIKTTLLEGKVKVSKTDEVNQAGLATANKALILKPGEQSQLSPGSRSALNRIRQVDLDEAVAWKNGQFQFKDTDLPTIMRQIARWYDVKVDYQGDVSDMKFRGKISRDVPLSQIFQILQLSGVNFTLNGRRIIVKT